MAKLSDRLTPHSMRRSFASFHIGAELQPEAAPAADGLLINQRHPKHVRQVVEP
jgi:hypothetical protein